MRMDTILRTENNVFKQNISKEIWEQKHRHCPEQTIWEYYKAIAENIFKDESEKAERLFNQLSQHKVSFGGRIMFGIGKENVTLSNCYVLPVLSDSMSGILETAKQAALTMKAGGGVGYNFSILRPKNSTISASGQVSSGVISFMKIFDSVCGTIISGGCFAGDTLVMTNKGLIPIEDIVNNGEADSVLTLDGMKKITARFKNGKRKVIKVILENGNEIKCTPDHNFFYLDENGDLKEKPISQFNVGDFVYLNTQTLEDNRTIADTLPFSSDFAYLLGFYFGNGSNITSEAKNTQYKGVSLTFTNNEVGLKCLEKCINIVKKDLPNINPIVHDGDGNCKVLYLHSVDFINTLNEFGLLKQKAGEIEIPKILYKCSKETIAKFIAGYFDADGHIKDTKKGYSITSVSKKMLQQVQQLLLEFGIMSKFFLYREEDGNWQNLYALNITGKTWQTRFKDLISKYGVKEINGISIRDVNYGFPFNLVGKVFTWKGVAKKTKSEKVSYNTVVQTIKDEKYNFIKSIVGVKIKEIIDLEEVVDVYDIEVEWKHHYFANGVLVHNSRRGAQLSALDVWHPDIFNYITAKRDGSLSNFNLSVAISDEFMKAVENNEDWDLVFPDYTLDKNKYDNEWNGNITNWIKQGGQVKVYNTVKARELYDTIIKSNYEFAEPGVLFIDTINKNNNLYYCETIQATNPCLTGDTSLYCLVNGTPKKMSLNKIVKLYNVEDIKVLGFNAQENRISYEKVIWGGLTQIQAEVFEIKTQGGEYIRATANHLFATTIEGSNKIFYKQAKDLQEGDIVIVYDYKTASNYIDKVEYVKFSSYEGVFDITVQNNHNFFANNILVHNCGEQPLPPYGSCNLASINLANFVINPFEDNATIDYDGIEEATELLVEGLDNILDINYYPLEEQKQEVTNKRQIGIGITGLADMLVMLKAKYSSAYGRSLAGDIMKFIANTAYRKSAELAKERGAFPYYDERFLSGYLVQKLDKDVRDLIREYGIRNSRLLSIAPTGTISLVMNNVSSGIEPIFSYEYERKVRNLDNTYRTEKVMDYAYLLYKEKFGEDAELPDYFETALNLSVDAHLLMQASLQNWICTSVSKTINIPEDYDYEDFKDVYKKAYNLGLKGCTTYRPNTIIGSILSTGEDKKEEPKEIKNTLIEKELLDIEDAKRHRIAWKNGTKVYVNVSIDEDGNPLEIFAKLPKKAGFDQNGVFDPVLYYDRQSDWEYICRLQSKLLRLGYPVEEIIDDAEKSSFTMHSLSALMKRVLSCYLPKVEDEEKEEILNSKSGATCPECKENTLVKEQGCDKCLTCGYSKCG